MTANVYLIAAIVGLVVAPAVYALVQRSSATQNALGGFILSSMSLLVLGHILPSAMHEGGAWAIAALIAGFLIPIAFEKKGRATNKRNELLLTVLALGGLMPHAFLDGVGLQVASNQHAELSAAIALHKLPVGLMIWWLLKPRYGWLAAAGALLAVAVSTVGGFFTPSSFLTGNVAALFSAFVGGTLLHVVVTEHGPKLLRRRPAYEALGAVFGVLLVLALPTEEHHEHSLWTDVGNRLWELAVETSPALLLGFILSGLTVAFLPRMSTNWLGKGTRYSQAGRGLVFGLPIPICSCGVVPLYESLLRRGVPTTAAMAFLIATPELGLDSLILTLPLLGGEFTGVRLVAASALALSVAVVVPMLVGPDEKQPPLSPEIITKQPLMERLKVAADYGLREVVDDTAPWILFGLLVAALIPPALLSSMLTTLPTGLDVVAAALIGIPFYICASGATPLAAAMIYAGLSPGAGLAFLLAGPATNITTFGVLRRNHGQKTAIAFGLLVSVTAIALGIAANGFLNASVITPPPAHGEHVSWFSLLCMALVGTLFAGTLFRLGPKALLSSVMWQGSSDEEDGCCEEESETSSGCCPPEPETPSGCCPPKDTPTSGCGANNKNTGGGHSHGGHSHGGHSHGGH